MNDILQTGLPATITPPAGSRYFYTYSDLPGSKILIVVGRSGEVTPAHRRTLMNYVADLPGWQVIANRNYRTKRWLDGRVWKIWRSTIAKGDEKAHVYVRELIAGEPMGATDFTHYVSKRTRRN